MDIIEKQDLEGEQQYNTQREKLWMPEYGRNVQKMVEYLKTIEDREKRNEQARAVVKVMEILNPQVHLQENYEQKLWDHLQIISGFTLDIDSPYPAPSRERFHERPTPIPIEKKPIRATHYGRNIESIIDLIVTMEDGPQKTAVIKSLAVYMRQQYLIWNKDSVADETIFKDIEKLSDYRIKVPEGIQLSRISSDASFQRPGIGQQKSGGKPQQRQKGMRSKKNRK
ncbi:MAG: DUF4290 domain-containing protein [Bacteroidales bacterium]|nr:DUF4290 domain-containing protein [Bacteroidales bacterium]MDY5357644.1 DUF4290 domain-containing protein [Candidatus Cryptobacteroides sp.]